MMKILLGFLFLNMQVVSLFAENQTDQKKWVYVKEEFSKCLEVSGSSMHQFGAIQQKYAIVPTVGAGIIAALICVIIAMGGRRIDRFIKIGSALVIPPLCMLPVYGLNKAIGRLLEANPDRYQKALGLFIKKWTKNKEKTPEILHSLFEALKADYKHGTFHTVDPQQAQALIECLLTVGILADSKLVF